MEKICQNHPLRKMDQECDDGGDGVDCQPVLGWKQLFHVGKCSYFLSIHA